MQTFVGSLAGFGSSLRSYAKLPRSRSSPAWSTLRLRVEAAF